VLSCDISKCRRSACRLFPGVGNGGGLQAAPRVSQTGVSI
jgi:Fe-S-cluster containining protein